MKFTDAHRQEFERLGLQEERLLRPLPGAGNVPATRTTAGVFRPTSAANCHVGSPWWSGIGSQVKLQGVYPMPYGVQLSGTLKNIPGIPWTASLVASNATVASSLGRNISACPATGTCTATVTNQIVPFALNTGSTPASAVLFDERLNEFDLRITKTIRLARLRLQPMVDLYNVFNHRPPQAINPTFGFAWLRPTSLLGGRLWKFGAQVDW